MSRSRAVRPAVRKVESGQVAELHLGPDTLRLRLRDDGDFVCEFKTGFGSKWNEIATGNIGDGECKACGGNHKRTRGDQG